MGVIASWGSGLAALLSYGFGGGAGWSGGARRRGTGRGLALFAEELLFAAAKLSFEFGDSLLEFGQTQFGFGVHGLPVGGPAKGLEAFGQMRADRTRPLGGRGGGTARSRGRGRRAGEDKR